LISFTISLSEKWLVKFNPNNTETMVISNKRNKPYHPPLQMNDQDLHVVKLVSSANSLISALISFTISFIKIINKRGPSMEPWGTPALIGNQLEFKPYSGKEVRVVFCDISKAFDRVWHKGLIHKLKQSGISENLLTISFIKILNKRGPSMEPWRTPALIGNQLEFEPLITTLCSLP
jgi:hypothetical protein